MKSVPFAFSPFLILATALAGTPDESVTYSRDIAPLMQEKCVTCHRPGASGPFQLTDYDSVKRRARTIQKVIGKGYMPPWHAIGGDVPIQGDRRLTENEIGTIEKWVDSGRPEGNPEDLPAPRVFPDGWLLGEPDLVLTMEETYELPADGPDIYRNFVIASGLKEDKYLKAVEFRPSSPEVVHHALIYVDSSGQSREVDAQDPEPGFAEMPVGEGTGRQVSGWVPGTLPKPLPKGLAHKVPAGSDIVIQTHFHLTGKPEKETSTIGLYFTDEPPTKPFTSIQVPPVFGAFSGINLAPGATNTTIVDTFEIPVDVEAFGVQPHAHYRGKSLRLTAKLPNENEEIILNIPEWDMNWQEEYRFAQPVQLPAGTKLTAKIVWDNSAESTDNPIVPPVRVRWGFESFDEMGSIDLFVVPTGKNPGKEMKTLRSAYRDHVVWVAGKHVLGDDKLRGFGKLRESAIARLDLDGDGKLSQEERNEARKILLSESMKSGQPVN